MTNHNTALLNACLEPIYSLHPDPSPQLPEQQSLPPHCLSDAGTCMMSNYNLTFLTQVLLLFCLVTFVHCIFTSAQPLDKSTPVFIFFFVCFNFLADPFADTNESVGNDKENHIHIRIQQRNGRKTLTTVQGLDQKYDFKKIVKAAKKVRQKNDFGKNTAWCRNYGRSISFFVIEHGLRHQVKVFPWFLS